MKRELVSFTHAIESGRVSYKVRHTPEEGNPLWFEYHIRSDVLDSIAVARSRPMWGYRDILEYHRTTNAEILSMPEQLKDNES